MPLSWRALASYGFLGLPLAMVALPVYVQLPAYYAAELGLPLALTGWVLFGARIIDTLQDAWLGEWVDTLARKGRLRGVLVLAAVLLAIAFTALWLPPFQGEAALAAWMALGLALVYTQHSLINISYLSWGARLAGDTPGLTRAAGAREAAALAGVLLASAVPTVLLESSLERTAAMGLYGAVFTVLLFGGVAALLQAAPPWQFGQTSSRLRWRQTLADPQFRALIIPYFLNAWSVSIPATLALFFINDRLQAPALAGAFLGGYFLAGAAGLPLWTRLADRIGPLACWRLGMVLAIVAFVWAMFLDSGDTLAYGVICLMAGLALGADLAMPPVILARQIPAHVDPASYYGLWSLLGKLALALSGLALPLLAALGYEPGVAGTGTAVLAWVYGGVPCALKLAAWFSLRGLSSADAAPVGARST